MSGYETVTQKIEMLERIVNSINDEISKADFPNADRWCEPLKKFRQTLWEEIAYLEEVRLAR